MSNNIRFIIIISLIVNVLLLTLLLYICFYKTDFADKAFLKLLGKVYVPQRQDDDCVNSWNNCVIQMDFNANVVFFGNSITAGCDWQSNFPKQRIVNLGYIGEDTKGMLRRVRTIAACSPQKVFVMAGINGLKNQNLDDFEKIYGLLIDSIKSSLPSAYIYIQSILPVTKNSDYCSNEKIASANERIVKIAIDRKLQYVDLYDLYAYNGALPDSMSYDGLHLMTKAYKPWLDYIKPYIEE